MKRKPEPVSPVTWMPPRRWSMRSELPPVFALPGFLIGLGLFGLLAIALSIGQALMEGHPR